MNIKLCIFINKLEIKNFFFLLENKLFRNSIISFNEVEEEEKNENENEENNIEDEVKKEEKRM